MDNKKIEIIWNSEITEIIGDENPLSVKQVVLRNNKDESSKNIDTDGIFVAIGHSPASKIFKNQLKLKWN